MRLKIVCVADKADQMNGMLRYEIPEDNVICPYSVYYSPLVPQIHCKDKDIVLKMLKEYYRKVGIEYTDEEILSEIIYDNPNGEFKTIKTGQQFKECLHLKN